MVINLERIVGSSEEAELDYSLRLGRIRTVEGVGEGPAALAPDHVRVVLQVLNQGLNYSRIDALLDPLG